MEEARRVSKKGWKGCLGGAWAAIPGAMRPAFPEDPDREAGRVDP
jgi:hypothetical protein